MKITKYFTKFSKQIIICLRENGLGEITIFRNMDYKEDAYVWLPSHINWAACGSQTIDKAVIFTDAMKIAAEIATALDNDQDIESYLTK